MTKIQIPRGVSFVRILLPLRIKFTIYFGLGLNSGKVTGRSKF